MGGMYFNAPDETNMGLDTGVRERRGYDLIRRGMGPSMAMEVMCPGIVSCADIIIGRFVAK